MQIIHKKNDNSELTKRYNCVTQKFSKNSSFGSRYLIVDSLLMSRISTCANRYASLSIISPDVRQGAPPRRRLPSTVTAGRAGSIR